MQFSRTQLAIAAGAGVLLLLIFFSTLIWLNRQGPVLSRSPELDPLSKIPISITLNPFRDRTSEHVAATFMRGLQNGHCRELLAQWERDYRKQYAAFICNSEAQHPLLSWKLVEWEDAPPLRILHYRGERSNGPGQSGSYKELLSVTLENRDGDWEVTKYDAMY
jgi:hypothetical protein